MYVFENLPLTLSHTSVICLRYTFQGNVISTGEGLYSEEMKEGAELSFELLIWKRESEDNI